jgi:hypothetical protein
LLLSTGIAFSRYYIIRRRGKKCSQISGWLIREPGRFAAEKAMEIIKAERMQKNDNKIAGKWIFYFSL